MHQCPQEPSVWLTANSTLYSRWTTAELRMELARLLVLLKQPYDQDCLVQIVAHALLRAASALMPTLDSYWRKGVHMSVNAARKSRVRAPQATF